MMSRPTHHRNALAAASSYFLLAATAAAAASPEGASRPPGQPQNHGEYVARAADCASCHTADPDKPFAGGYAFYTKFGTLYSSNITPAPETGIGGWTEEEFERALRHGIRRDGAYLYPAMPYEWYTRMTPEDAHALWRYFSSVEPIENEVPDDDLIFPMSIRDGLAVWRAMYFEPGEFAADPDRTDQWNRGAYLVESLGHCGACHTPRTVAEGTIEAEHLTGRQLREGWWAPNIGGGPLSDIADWSVEDLAAWLRGAPDAPNVAAAGPMGDVISHSLKYLTDADVTAIAVYLKDQPAPAEPREAPEQVEIAQARLATGRELYGVHCMSCHGPDGMGVEGQAPRLAGNSSVSARAPYTAIKAVLEGFEPREQWPEMPAFGGVLSNRDIADIVNYLRKSLGRAEPNATPWMVGAMRFESDAPQLGATSPDFICPPMAADDLSARARKLLGEMAPEQVSDAELERLVDSYGSDGDAEATINGLMTAYCPYIAEQDIGYGEKGARLAEFTGRVAELVVARRDGQNHARSE